jgi:hypothetical protein
MNLHSTHQGSTSSVVYVRGNESGGRSSIPIRVVFDFFFVLAVFDYIET